MAPALTQSIDPPNLADATRHSPPPKPATSASSLYDHLKEHRNIRKVDINAILITGQTLIPNGDCVPPGLAPPACGRAEGRPAPNNSPYRSSMDGHLPLSVSDTHIIINQLPVSSISSSVNTSMGLQSCITNVNVASDPCEKAKGSEAITSSSVIEDTPVLLGNQNELLALVGRDFNNVNDIIDTLQRLASNPELLDAAARDLEPDNPTTNCDPSVISPEDCAANILVKLAERQHLLESKRLFLLRRLHRITSRGLGMTISTQVCQLIRYSRTLVEQKPTELQKYDKNMEADILKESLRVDNVKFASVSDWISASHQVDSSKNTHETPLSEKQIPEVENLIFPSSIRSQLNTVTAQMKSATLGHVHHDSDATESSSGGESCDELEAFHKTNTCYKPVKERSFYKYCRTRGLVASKWTWLQNQIAQLDCKINEQQELYLKLRASKDVALLSEDASNAQRRLSVRNPAHFDMQDPALTCIASPSIRSTINGYHPANKVNDSSLIHGLNGGIHDSGGGECARTLGVQKVRIRQYVKLRRHSMAGVTKRSLGDGGTSASKYRDKVPSILCKCVPPLSCILCERARYSKNVSYGNHFISPNKAKVLTVLTHPGPHPLAKLDPSFHPILSEIAESLQSEYYKSTMGSVGWQQKFLQGKLSAHHPKKEVITRSDNEEEEDDEMDYMEPHIKRRRKELKKNGKRFREDVKEKLTSYMHRSTRRSHAVIEDYEDEYGGWHVSVGSANSSPCPSPAPSDKAERIFKPEKYNSDAKDGSGRVLRKHTASSSFSSTPTTTSSTQSSLATNLKHKPNSAANSYDINNIVIPYSMAASGRVELLKYKEIPTPKWRIEEIKPLAASMKNKVELEEDISDEAITARHSRSEAMERTKFAYFVGEHANSTRSSRSRRTDSSGTNTPDHPLSPRLSEQEHGESSPMGSPPGTPLVHSEESNHSLPQSQATVLTLSLSSLQSSLLDSNPSHNSTEPINKHLINQSSYSDSNVFCDPAFTHASSSLSSTSVTTTIVDPISATTSKGNRPITPVSLISVVEGQPALRTHRLMSGNGLERRARVISISQDDPVERDRVSPFPCRDFPLTENDYQDLVIEDLAEDNDESDEVVVSTGSVPLETDARESPIELVDLKNDVSDSAGNTANLESGRDSPISELTDSAPEEDGVWDDETTPDWTISAVHDHSGGMVLQVQKN